MPLIGPTSYAPTLIEFLAHWKLVDERLSDPLVVEGLDLAGALALQAELEGALKVVGTTALDVRLVRAGLAAARESARAGHELFSVAMRAHWTGSPWMALLPKLPKVGAALDKFLRPCRDAVRLWALLETEPLPPGVTLPILVGPEPGMSRAELEARVEAARVAGLALEEAEQVAAVARRRRDMVLARVKSLLKAYTRLVPSRLGSDSPEATSIPRLWPLPGHTPEPVTAAGAWDAEAGAARLSWEASAEAQLSHYEVRMCPGADYTTEEETVLGRVKPEGERLWLSPIGLEVPGAEAAYRIYVVLETGNERGSETLRVVRPG